MRHSHLIPVIVCFLLFSFSSFAQISEGGVPPSFSQSSPLRSDVDLVDIPIHFSIEDLTAVNDWGVNNGKPFAVAKIIPVDISIDNSGTWSTLSDGTKIWQLRIHAEQARALTLLYDQFEIPEGGQLFLYNPDGSAVIGAFTYATNPPTLDYATEFIPGDETILEYVSPSSGALPKLSIESVGYGFNNIATRASSGRPYWSSESGSCNVNINCSEGDNWQNQKKGVCAYHYPLGDYIYSCSGSLINNTALDFKPYILSAFHCFSLDDSTFISTTPLNQTVFYFHFEHTTCDNTSDISPVRSIVGCTRVAYSPFENGSDGALVLLNQSIPDNYVVFFNGWDRTPFPPLNGVGIHHPLIDYMKISTFGSYFPSYTAMTESTSNLTTMFDADLSITYDPTVNGHGIVESGSSGSPVFNQNGQIVGTLSGSNTTCKDPNSSCAYGRLYAHWDLFGTADSTHLSPWLDPDGSQVMSLSGMSQDGSLYSPLKAPQDLTASLLDQSASISWKAPEEKQIVSWSNLSLAYLFSFDKDPFYYGQHWDAADLSSFDNRTITHVICYPTDSATYSLYIRQGSRAYSQLLSDYEPYSLTSAELYTPFTIDANEDLYVSLYVSSFPKNFYPGLADDQPALDGYGNVYSFDGLTWESDTTDFDVNFPIGFVLSSDYGTSTTVSKSSSLQSLSTPHISSSSSRKALSKRYRKPNIHLIKNSKASIEPFHTLTGYNIYRDDVLLTTLPSSTVSYTDATLPTGTHIYGLSAIYDSSESATVTVSLDNTVDIQKVDPVSPFLSPVPFTDYVRLIHPETVRAIDVYSAEGRLLLSLKSPIDRINTSSFNPGVYFFRLTQSNGKVSTVKTVKK